MTLKRSVLVVSLLWSASAGAAQAPQVAPPDVVAAAESLDRNLTVFSEVLGLVHTAYVDEPGNELMAGAFENVTDALDPFSLYVPAAEVESYLQSRKVGWRHSGAVILEERGVAYVAAVEKGGPAARIGVEAGDIVASINDRSARLMPAWEIQKLLAAEPGTKVGLELVRQGERRKVALVLWPFAMPTPSLLTGEGASVMHIPTFNAATVSAVKRLLVDHAASDNRGLVVDLRGVSSGDPDVAYEVAGHFAAGELGGLIHRNEELQLFASDRVPVWRGRLVVLVDRSTLGPAEILATILRQKAGAALVGERTFGHAGTQGIAELSNGGRLFYTEAFYTGPDGKPLREGLEPDVKVDARSRTSVEKDVPIAELILKRGLLRLLEPEGAQP